MKIGNILIAVLVAVMMVLFLNACEFNPQPPGDKYALVYGIQDYYGTENDLSFTDNDAIDIAGMLAAKGYQVRLRVSGEAPSASLQSLLADYSTTVSTTQFNADMQYYQDNLQKDDTFLFYFSGHGATESGSIISRSEDSASAAGNEFIIFSSASGLQWYSDDSFYYSIRLLPTERNIVIIDACNSGGFIGQAADVDINNPEYSSDDETRDTKLGLMLNAYFTPDSTDIPPTEAIVITAAGELEVSLEVGGAYNHGIFTYYLLQSSGHDPNGDGVVTTGEAYAYVRHALLEWWNPQWNGDPDQEDLQYYPRISGGPVDYVLFDAD